MSDSAAFSHQDNRASDYEFGMGSGRPACEEKSGLLGFEHGAHHHSKMKELLEDAEHMLHKEKRGKKDDQTHNASQ